MRRLFMHVDLSVSQPGDTMTLLPAAPQPQREPTFGITDSELNEMSSFIDMLEESGATADNIVWQVLYAWRGIEPQIRTRPHTPAPEQDDALTAAYLKGKADGERTATLAENKRVLDATESIIRGYLLYLHQTYLPTDITVPSDVEYIMLKIKESLRTTTQEEEPVG
jgi:hypothetical protein